MQVINVIKLIYIKSIERRPCIFNKKIIYIWVVFYLKYFYLQKDDLQFFK